MISEDEYFSLIPSFVHILNRYCDKKYYITPSVRDFHNFMLVESGEGMYIKGNTEIPMTPMTLIYNKPGQSFGYYASKQNPMHVFGINVYLSSVKNTEGEWKLSNVDQLPFENITLLKDIDRLSKLFTDLYSHWENNKVDFNINCRSIFLNILGEMYNQIHRPNYIYNLTPPIKAAVYYIKNNYQKNISIETLCKISGLTSSYLGKLFKKQTGNTPIEYINKTKIQKSEELLNIGFSITEVSEMLAFSSPFYFSLVFKKIKGIPPREFAKSPFGD